jgi:hypothetical protein
MSSSDGAAVISVRGPADLIAAVPYLLGFHPRQSLVIVGMAKAQVVVTMRIDLDDLVEAMMIDRLSTSMARGGAEELVAVVYDDHGDPTASELAWNALVRQLSHVAGATGLTVEDAFLVCGDRFWSYACDDPRCCPPEGTPVPQNSPLAAAATFAGLVALPDRLSVAGLLAPAPLAERLALGPALAAAQDAARDALVSGSQTKLDRSAIRALFVKVRASAAAASALPTEDAVLAYLGVALRRIEVRDAVWMGIDDGRLTGDALWRLLLYRLPSPFDAAPLFLLGWTNWRQGNGAMARIAAERALDSDPSYSAARLLQAALVNAVDPRTMPTLTRRGRRCDR